MGTARYSLMEPKHVRKCRDRKAEWPESANGRIKALRQVFAWAIEAGHAKSNPAKDVPYLKGSGTGFHTWTIEEVRQYEQRHPISSKARLALALLLLTGQRRSDIITFGKQHVREAKNVPANLRTVHRGRWLAFTQRKNKKRKPISLMVPLLPELEEIIAATPRRPDVARNAVVSHSRARALEIGSASDATRRSPLYGSRLAQGWRHHRGRARSERATAHGDLRMADQQASVPTRVRPSRRCSPAATG
jgi:integrase